MNTNAEIALIVTYFLGLLAGILFAQMVGRFHMILPQTPEFITCGYDQTVLDSEEEQEHHKEKDDDDEDDEDEDDEEEDEDEQDKEDEDDEDEEKEDEEESRPGKQTPPPESEFTMTENPMLRHREVHQEESVMHSEPSQLATDS